MEAGQFAIFPWFPPYDTDVSGTRWIAMSEATIAAEVSALLIARHPD